MKKALSNQIKTRKSNIIVILATMIMTYVVGVVLISGLLHSDDTATRYIVIGTPLALGMGLFVNFFLIIGNYIEGFQTSIAMGRTRKTYIIANYISECLIILGMVLMSVVMFFIENAVNNIIYVGYEYNDVYKDIFSNFGYIAVVAIVILVLPIVGMFVSALYQRFGKVVFWVVWGVYMLVTMSGSGLEAVVMNNIANLMLDNTIVKAVIAVVAVIAVIGMAVSTMSLSLKQEVKNY